MYFVTESLCTILNKKQKLKKWWLDNNKLHEYNIVTSNIEFSVNIDFYFISHVCEIFPKFVLVIHSLFKHIGILNKIFTLKKI